MDEETVVNKVIKITMPIGYSRLFLTETKDKFGDCRWLHIAFKDSMYNALYAQKTEDIKEEISKAIELIKNYRNEEIKAMAREIKYYREQLNKR